VIDSNWMDTKLRSEFCELTVEENCFLEEEANQGFSRRSVSALQLNRSKNRYTSFRPLDETRVVLETIPGIECSDYINASFVAGETPNSYIACQAPMDSTTSDFWRMIWEQGCGVIIMVTDLEHNKTSQYWPSEGEVLRFGQLLVCHKKNFELGEIDVHSLLVKNDGGSEFGETREIIHLQYRHWPDFGVPSSTKVLRDLISLSNKFKTRATEVYNLGGPMVVHCSAGVGRTGAFIACHMTLEQLRNNQSPDIKQIVRSIRNQRQGMVRTQEQYALIYAVLFDAMRSKHTRGVRSSGKSLRTSSDCLRSSADSLRLSSEAIPMETVMD